MRMRFSRLAAIPFLAVAWLTGAAQQAGAPGISDGGLIAMNVVVTPGNHGKPIAGLAQSNFTVLDNGSPQPITSFRALNGQAAPVKVLLVVDAVNLDFQRVAYGRQQTEKFLHANNGKLSQPTALAIFTDKGTQIQQNFSTDGNALSQELEKQVIGLRDIRRSAGIYGAEERIDLSLKTLSQLVERAGTEPGRKFIIWITPGWPLLSGPELQLSNKQQREIFRQVVAFSDALRKSNTTLYAVDPRGAGSDPGRTFFYEQFVKGLKKFSDAEPGDLGIQVLAEQTGGRFLTGSNDIGALLEQCFADATARYEIAYRTPPAETPSEYHRIEVHLADTHLVARTTHGYYSPR